MSIALSLTSSSLCFVYKIKEIEKKVNETEREEKKDRKVQEIDFRHFYEHCCHTFFSMLSTFFPMHSYAQQIQLKMIFHHWIIHAKVINKHRNGSNNTNLMKKSRESNNCQSLWWKHPFPSSPHTMASYKWESIPVDAMERVESTQELIIIVICDLWCRIAMWPDSHFLSISLTFNCACSPLLVLKLPVCSHALSKYYHTTHETFLQNFSMKQFFSRSQGNRLDESFFSWQLLRNYFLGTKNKRLFRVNDIEKKY